MSWEISGDTPAPVQVFQLILQKLKSPTIFILPREKVLTLLNSLKSSESLVLSLFRLRYTAQTVTALLLVSLMLTQRNSEKKQFTSNITSLCFYQHK